MTDSERLQRLETQIATLRVDLDHHDRLCDSRWRVAWKLAALVGGIIALAVSAAVSLWR